MVVCEMQKNGWSLPFTLLTLHNTWALGFDEGVGNNSGCMTWLWRALTSQFKSPKLLPTFESSQTKSGAQPFRLPTIY